MNIKSFLFSHKKLILSVFCLKVLYFLSFFGIGASVYFTILGEAFLLKYVLSIIFLLVFGFYTLLFLTKKETELKLEIQNFKRS